MERSESIKELATALAKAQGEIQGAVRDSENPFFKSKYADLSSVVEAIKPAHKHGLSFVQPVHSVDGHASIETIILHESGEWLSCGRVTVQVLKQDAQSYGSALTYCRRYSLSAAFGVAPEDDDGNEASKNTPQYTRPAVQGQKTAQEPPKTSQPTPNPPPPDPNAQIGLETATKFLSWASANVKGGPKHLNNAVGKYFPGKALAELTGKEAGALRAHLEGKAQLTMPGDSDDKAVQVSREVAEDKANGADPDESYKWIIKHSAFDGNEVYPARWAEAADNADKWAVVEDMAAQVVGREPVTS